MEINNNESTSAERQKGWRGLTGRNYENIGHLNSKSLEKFRTDYNFRAKIKAKIVKIIRNKRLHTWRTEG